MKSPNLTDQQRAAILEIEKWHATGTSQVFRLFGPAGTGKTTLVREIADRIGGRILYGAYSGKAAHVMATKGCTGAATIHSLIYVPKQRARFELSALEAKLGQETDPDKRRVLARVIAEKERELDQPHFILKDDSPLRSADLLVIDEVSMVNEAMARDLMSFDCPLLVLGDPAQLPPIKGTGYFIDTKPDMLLTEIHRSALDSPVTRIATTVRNSSEGDSRLGLDWHSDGDSGCVPKVKSEEMLEFDQVVVGKNTTRWKAIHDLRRLNGLSGPPCRGDRIIFLANNPNIGIFNGQQATVLHSEKQRRSDVLRLVVREDDNGNQERTIDVWASGFTGEPGEWEAKKDARGAVAAATFGQVITAHKSQGSQWESVLVIDENRCFPRAERRPWLYTAITRAAKRVVITDKAAA